jgi:predicted secreted protein
MTTNAEIGYGVLFKIFDTSPSPDAYVTVGEVTSIKMPGLKRDAVDATHTESTDKYREFIPGLKDAGEVTVEMNFVSNSNTDKLIRTRFDADTLTQCRIQFPGASPADTITFNAIFTSYEADGPVDGIMKATLTMKISGKPTYAP